MQYRRLGRTDLHVSAIGFGAWAIGGFWGRVTDEDSMRALHAAIDAGVNFIDTADVYGDGRSERLVARLRRERRGETIQVATKAGRKLPEQTCEGYTRENLTAWIDESRRNLEVEALDLLQLHCPPAALYQRPEVFGILDDLVAAGKLRYYGVSVETVEEALAAMRHPGVRTVQIIFNMFRLKPAERVLPEARAKGIGILARVPLASGLLTGKLRRDTVFAPDDHRRFNREGQMFDRGETLSGVPYEVGLDAVERLRPLVPPGASLAQLALRWILMFDGVTCTIPGAKTERQARENAAAADLPPLDAETMRAVQAVYDAAIRPHVHGAW
jgi:aryl-alcohol dehydrogenase-like predicted oxidoreductase